MCAAWLLSSLAVEFHRITRTPDRQAGRQAIQGKWRKREFVCWVVFLLYLAFVIEEMVIHITHSYLCTRTNLFGPKRLGLWVYKWVVDKTASLYTAHVFVIHIAFRFHGKYELMFRLSQGYTRNLNLIIYRALFHFDPENRQASTSMYIRMRWHRPWMHGWAFRID